MPIRFPPLDREVAGLDAAPAVGILALNVGGRPCGSLREEGRSRASELLWAGESPRDERRVIGWKAPEGITS